MPLMQVFFVVLVVVLASVALFQFFVLDKKVHYK